MGGQQPSPHSGSPLTFPEHSGLRAEQQAEGVNLIVCFFSNVIIITLFI